MKNIILIDQLINATGITSLGQDRTTNSNGSFTATINRDALNTAKKGGDIAPETQIIGFFSVYGHGVVEMTYSEICNSTFNSLSNEWVIPDNKNRPFDLTLSLFNSSPVIKDEESLMKQIMAANSILYNSEIVSFNVDKQLLSANEIEQADRLNDIALNMSIHDGNEVIGITLAELLENTMLTDECYTWSLKAIDGDCKLSPRNIY
jgi:hypothetical protein